MRSEQTGYSSNHQTDPGEELAQDLAKEMTGLDWSRRDNAPIREAAALMYEAGTDVNHPNEISRHRLLADMLIQVPDWHRVETIAAVPQDLREEMLDKMPPFIREAVNEHFHQAETEARTTGHRTGHQQDWDLERAQHALNYVTEACGQEAAQDLRTIMLDSRDLEIRQMRGHHPSYGNDTHLRYVQCVTDIPLAVEAQRRMDPENWGAEQLREAAQHEVNRMAYRFNLEIQDRLTSQYSIGTRKPILGTLKRLDGETIGQLREYGEGRAEHADYCRHMETPDQEMLLQQGRICIMDLAMEKALVEGTPEEIRKMIEASQDREIYLEQEDRIKDYVGRELTNPIDRAIETAGKWPDRMVKEGGRDYHLEFTVLRFTQDQQERGKWLEEPGHQAGARNIDAGDCTTRALNEALGGGHYGEIWDRISEAMEAAFPGRDADHGAGPNEYREAYLAHGMQEVLGANLDPENLMFKHLDLREVPAIIGSITGEKPQAFIACSESHAVAVVGDELRDAWDSRNIGDRTTRMKDGRLMELWVRCDDDTAAEIREILERYAQVRRFDDALTLGKRWRMS